MLSIHVIYRQLNIKIIFPWSLIILLSLFVFVTTVIWIDFSRLSLSLVFTNSTLIYNACFNWIKFVVQYTYWNSANIYVILVFSFPFYFALSKLRLYEKSKKSKPRVNKIFKWEKCIHEVLDKHSYIYKSVYFKNHNNLFIFGSMLILSFLMKEHTWGKSTNIYFN